MDNIFTGKSTYDIESYIYELSTKFFKNQDGTNIPVNKLRNGLYGWLSETQSNLAFNSISTKSGLYEENFINTAKLPQTIYNNAIMYNFNVNLAEPAILPVKLNIKFVDIINISRRSEQVFRISNSTVFQTNGMNFKLRYDIIIEYKLIGSNITDGSLSATYDKSTEQFDTFDTYDKLIPINYNPDTGMVTLVVDLYQLEKTVTTFEYIEQDSFLNKSFKVNFFDQLSKFRVFYKETPYSERIELNTYLGSEEVNFNPNEKKCNYEYNGTNSLNILFVSNTGFRPSNNSIIEVETYTTVGSSGNINYNGSLIPVFDNKFYYDLNITTTPIGVGSGGLDKPSPNEIKARLLAWIQSKGEMITDTDIDNYIKSIQSQYLKNNSKFTMTKDQNDLLSRSYKSYVLLKDNDNIVIPTTTVDLSLSYTIIESNDMDYFKKSMDGSKVLIPSGSYIVLKKTVQTNMEGYVIAYNYSDYTVSQYPEENLFNENDMLRGSDNWLSYYRKYPDAYTVYKTPYDILIDSVPFLRAVYYRTSLDDTYQVNKYNMNHLFGKSFTITEFDIYRNSMNGTDNDTYTLSFELNTNVNKKYINNNILSGPDRNQINAIILFFTKDDDGNRTYYGFKNCVFDESSNGNPYKFYSEFKTLYKMDEYDSTYLKLFKIDSETSTVVSNTLQEVKVPRDVNISILVNYDPNDGNSIESYFQPTSDNQLQYASNTTAPDLYDTAIDGSGTTIGLVNIINVLEVESVEPVKIFVSLGNVVSSNITYTGQSYVIKELPLITADYIENDERFQFFINAITNYENMFKTILSRIDGSSSLNLKYFNTCGKSSNFTINNTDINISCVIGLREQYTPILEKNIIKHIVSFMNNINDIDINRFSFSNLSTSLENNFPQISSVFLNDINGLRVYEIDEKNVSDIPEYLNIGYDYINKKFKVKLIFK